jgi:isocitrate dehydrogenase
VLGSAVNPVLREGNSDRRVAAPVKNYAKKNPHTLGMWSRASRSHVAHMTKGDFYGTELSYIMPKAGSVKIQHTDASGKVTVLKESLKLLEGEIIDASYLSVKELRTFLEKEMEDALKNHMLFSVHLKATMMKISDPVMFGHVVTVFFKTAFDKHAETLQQIGFNPNNGLGDLYEKLKKVPEVTKQNVLADIQEVYNHRPW